MNIEYIDSRGVKSTQTTRLKYIREALSELKNEYPGATNEVIKNGNPVESCRGGIRGYFYGGRYYLNKDWKPND
ncbi:MAG: hypothetical protein PHW73_02310 [Atribacterota bacterium]|nr:hypothetical protein [Atribacterota bacterium]